MAISVNPETRVITIPHADLTLISGELHELDVDWFFLQLKDWEDSEVGMTMPDAQRHGPPVTLSGVTYAQTLELINGYTVLFENVGHSYTVRCVGANHNLADTTNFTGEVSLIIGNSAGLVVTTGGAGASAAEVWQHVGGSLINKEDDLLTARKAYSKEAEDRSFLDSRIWIDPDNGVPGTTYPIGTHSKTVNNHLDAKAIIVARDFAYRYALRGILTESTPASVANENWLGENSSNSGFVFTGGVDVANSIFKQVRLSGSITGRFSLDNGLIENLSGFMGDCQSVGFSGTITMPAGVHADTIVLKDCYSNAPGTDITIFDFNDATTVDFRFRGWTGGIEIRNFSDATNLLSIDMVSGHVTLHSSCTAGTIIIRGAGHVTDESVGADVIKKGLVHTDNLLQEKRWIALQ